MIWRTRLATFLCTLGLLAPAPTLAQPRFVAFESGHVRPLVLANGDANLLVVNTPDGRLEIFDVDATGLSHAHSVPVGLEPVSVAVRDNGEAWVVNHLSDSVSIVDTTAHPPQVIKPLAVGDEPRDIVFAGGASERAFITTAHRGQQRSDPSLASVPGSGGPDFFTPGTGRADVWVFDADSTGPGHGGTPVEILSFFADTPRALATSFDGTTVYVAAFQSGNQTTTILEEAVCDGFESAPQCNTGAGDFAPGGNPGPSDNHAGVSAPEVGLIVKYDNAASQWQDELGRSWNDIVKFDLPDQDVFAFDPDTLAPKLVPHFAQVGTVLFNMAVNPLTGMLYVTNTEALNSVRFEGTGVHGGSTVRGHLVETRITVIDPLTGTVSPKHLNQHVDFSQFSASAHAGSKPHSLSNLRHLVVSSDGQKIYAAAMGSAKVAVFDTADIEDANFATNFDPTVKSSQYLDVGEGPSGVALDETHGRLYVTTRFDNSVRAITLSNGSSETHAMHNPESAAIIEGRPFLYDAQFSSSNGTAACADCHIDGDLDHLAWDLGDPDGDVSQNTQPVVPGSIPESTFHPMKGPMTTQTLRGLKHAGGQHWRGDRVDGFFGTDDCTQPESQGAPCNGDFSFTNFSAAFEGLLGREEPLSAGEMEKFARFAQSLMLPPNPERNFDTDPSALTPDQLAGALIFVGDEGRITDGSFNCQDCHTLDASRGLFGTGGQQTFEGETQNFKVPHLRNQYTKVGMFGTNRGDGDPHMGDQIRGFGFLHDGAVDTLVTFLAADVFNLTQTEREQTAETMMVFDTDVAPIVGQQVTLTSTNAGAADPRIDLLIERASTSFESLMLGGAVTECDLVVKGVVGGRAHGWLLQEDGDFADDSGGTITDTALRSLSLSDGPLTYTCTPPGTGFRTALDHDLDTLLDGVETNTGIFNDESDTGTSPDLPDSDFDGWEDAAEVMLGSDPTDASSVPATTSVPGLPALGLALLALSLGSTGAAHVRRRGWRRTRATRAARYRGTKRA